VIIFKHPTWRYLRGTIAGSYVKSICSEISFLHLSGSSVLANSLFWKHSKAILLLL